AADVFAHLSGHLLHPAGHVLRIIFIDPAGCRGIPQTFQAALFRFWSNDSGYQTCEPLAVTEPAPYEGRITDAPYEHTGLLLTILTVIFIIGMVPSLAARPLRVVE